MRAHVASAALFCLLWLQTLGNLTPKALYLSTGLWCVLFGVALLWKPGEAPKLPERRGLGVGLGLVGLVMWGVVLFMGVKLGKLGALGLWGAGALSLALGGSVLLAKGVLDERFTLRLGVGMGLGGLMLWVPPFGGTYQRLALLPAEHALVGPVLVAVACVLVAIWVVGEGRRLALAFGALVLVLVCLRGLGLWAWEVHPGTRDMLALVEAAHERLGSGRNPYAVYQMQRGSEIPLTYLPGLWGLYGLPKLAGLDLRWSAVVAEALLFVGLWWGAKGTIWRGRVVGFCAVWMTLPSVQWNVIYAEPMLWWALLVWSLALMVRGKMMWAALVLGVALCTRHFAVLLLPFFTVAWVRQLGWRGAAEMLGITGGVCAVVLTPFVLWDPEMFWFGTLRWLREYGPVHNTWFWDKFSFAKVLYQSGWIKHAPWMQGGVLLLGTAGFGWWQSKRRGGGVAGFWILAPVYLLFVMLNGLIWYSFFLGTLLCVLVTTMESEAALEPRRTWWRLGLFVVALACGGLIVQSLMVQMSNSDAEDVAKLLAKKPLGKVKVLDQSTRRLEFIQPKSLVTGHRARSVWQVLASPNDAKLWQVRDTTIKPDPHLLDLSKAIKPSSTQRVGKQRLSYIELPASHLKLSQRIDPKAFHPTYIDPSKEPVGLEPLTQRSPTLFHAAPVHPAWARVERRRCKIPQSGREMLFVHPLQDRTLRLSWREVTLGQGLVIMGGIESAAVRWGMEDVRVKVHLIMPDRKHPIRHELVLENRPGLRGLALDTTAYQGQSVGIDLEFRTSNAAQRWVCVEGLVLGGGH